MAHAAARWQAAEGLVAQGVGRHQIDAGLEWSGWHLYDQGAQRLREEGRIKQIPFPPEVVLDPVYALSDVQLDGYVETGSLSYVSWLSGGQDRRVLLLQRECNGTEPDERDCVRPRSK